MHVILADTAGFCMGVSLALKRLDKLIDQNDGQRPIVTLGPIIHNPQVLAAYAERGVTQIDDPADAPAGGTVIIRAHGVPRPVEDALHDRGAVIVDATCPKVKKAQLLIEEQSALGKRLLLLGEENHPEVRGLLSYAGDDALVFDSLEELEQGFDPGRESFLAAQTTQDRKLFDGMRRWLEGRAPGSTVLETICDATRIRQQEAIHVAREANAMVVAGGFNSGNTRRLVKVIRDQGTPCVHVETADELDPADFVDAEIIGLTAGASTPDTIINEIYNKLRSF
jgi:4-hydroxy-3-methylbut-2-en-1-yl diphosphate reductase